ncbi:MAG TPA: hypothetical protein VGH92_04000 [Gaiellaceae bacterium]
MARRAVAISGGVVVVAAVVVLGLWLWLGSYAPLRALDTGYAPGPGIGADVQPVSGSSGRPVFFPAVRRRHSFDTAFTLHNTGRFGVTITGLEAQQVGAPPWLGATKLLATTSSTASADPGELVPLESLRIDPGDDAIVVVRFSLRCAGATSGSPDVYSDRVRLRYSYLSMFTRTATIRLPFAVTLRCVGGPPASP